MVETRDEKPAPKLDLRRLVTFEAEPAKAPLAALRAGIVARLGDALPAVWRGRAAVIEARAGARAPQRSISAYWLSFLFVVLAPTFAASLYLAIFAADRYEAETRFSVTSQRSEALADKVKSALSSSSSSSSSGGFSAANQDAYIVAGYIRSRAIIDDIGRDIDLRAIFRRPEADFWARLKADASVEELTDYWRSMVRAYVDPPSGIVTVDVSAFRREDALTLAKAIVKQSEAVANKVSERARADTMGLAETEVRRSGERVVASLADLRAFRDRSGFIDPAAQADSTGSLLQQLLSQRIRAQNEYAVSSHAMSPEAPTLQATKARLDKLDEQIAELKAKLTSGTPESAALANLLPRYEELRVQNQFSERLYEMAQDSLERARLRAEAQTIYVNVFVPPALPEDARYPERFASSAIIAAALLVIWGIGALIAALVEDHRL